MTGLGPGCVKKSGEARTQIKIRAWVCRMTHFVEGEDRTQRTLFPERLDDYIGDDSPVRVINAPPINYPAANATVG